MPADKVERVKNVAMGGQELATVVGDLVVDVANAIRTAEKQSLLEAAQGAMLPHALRLKQMTGKIGADAVQWIKQGGLWRGILFTAVGGVSVTTFLGLTGFLLAGLVATANAAVISFLMCLSAVGAFLAMFCTSLAVIYVGGLAATAVAIGSAVVVASSAILFVTGWILFAWAIWEGMRKSWNFVSGMFFGGGSPISMPSAPRAPRAPRHPNLRERGSPLAGFTVQNGQEALA